MSLQERVVTIDTREPKHFISLFSECFKRYGYTINVRALQCGDIETTNAIVERKSITDFVNSLWSKRLDNQLNRMVSYSEQCNKIPIVVIHGNPYNVLTLPIKDSGKTLNEVLGAIASIVCRYGVLLLWFDCDRDAVEVTTRLCVKIDDGKFLVPRKVDKTVILSRLLGIPVKTTRRLLKEFGSIKAICDANVDDLCRVKGIGIKTAKRIKQVLEGKLDKEGCY